MEGKLLNETPGWGALRTHYEKIKNVHLRQLFAEDPDRGKHFTVEGENLYLDYSKNRITDETVRLLVQLARERGVERRRDAMFRGEKINVTEKRAVLHVALRAPKGASILLDGENVVPQVHAVLDDPAEEVAAAGGIRGLAPDSGAGDAHRAEAEAADLEIAAEEEGVAVSHRARGYRHPAGVRSRPRSWPGDPQC